MPKTRLIAIAGDGGAYTQIAATIPAGQVEIVEDGSVAGQGLAVQYPADGYATTDTYPAGQPIEITGHGQTGVLGYPAQPDGRAADIYCQVRSATATGTTVRVVESET